ncbi:MULTISPECIES: hypothetical protein [unclassified Rickettsia]|uniref:hypothetical protein n=1 Tax=unclassified Rickettsia TaxID=114295 RepID=UPI003132B7B0
MKIYYKDEIIDFLKNHENQKFTPNELAKWFVENYPEEAEQKANASKNKKMLEANTPEEKHKVVIGIYAGEISSSKLSGVLKHEPNIQVILKPKIRFYYTQNPDAQINNQPSTNHKTKTNKEKEITEEQVSNVLGIYLQDKLKIRNMQIKHNTSSNKRGSKGNNIWLHPDRVGMQELNNKWDSVIKECAKYLAGQQAKLWSFEIKTTITRGNLRESFFQALSNSSWAHYGYLVASKLAEDNPDTRHELEMLCTRHGIGFILIDMKNPENSKISIPAKERAEIDWNMANRLAEENKDFKGYLDIVSQFHRKTSNFDSNFEWFTTNKKSK